MYYVYEEHHAGRRRGNSGRGAALRRGSKLQRNALVRDHLSEIARRENRARGARARLLELSKRSRAKLGTKSWTRQDLHER